MSQAGQAARDRPSYEPDHPTTRARSGRRQVTITGHPDRPASPRRLRAVPERHEAPAPAPVAEAPAEPSRPRPVVHVQRRRPARRPTEHLSANPDRLAMWALLMALFLVAVAAVSQ